VIIKVTSLVFVGFEVFTAVVMKSIPFICFNFQEIGIHCIAMEMCYLDKYVKSEESYN
jgi:hypothetical protein